MGCSPSVYVHAMVLLDRVQEQNPELIITPRNVHRLAFIAILISAKYLDDFYYKNSYYATVGGLPLPTICELEVEFLTLLNYDCSAQVDTFHNYLERLETFLELSEDKLA